MTWQPASEALSGCSITIWRRPTPWIRYINPPRRMNYVSSFHYKQATNKHEELKMQIREHYIESFNKIKSKHGSVLPHTYIMPRDVSLPKAVGYTSKFIVDDGEEHYRLYFRNACEELFAALSYVDIYIEDRYIRGPDRSWMRARLNQEISNGKRRSNKSQI